MEKSLPSIPAKRYFTIGEVSELCGVKPYVLRYWEQEFTQLKPMKRRGNRRYYQHHEVLLIRRIRELLYEQGFTISGARNRLVDGHQVRHEELPSEVDASARAGSEPIKPGNEDLTIKAIDVKTAEMRPSGGFSIDQIRQELLSIRSLLSV
jgi:DNA-binding transcriptional MerR regulator